MTSAARAGLLGVCVMLTTAAAAAEVGWQPFAMDWQESAGSAVDLSGFLERPAGKAGFVHVQGEHLLTGDGARWRIWGVNICSADCFPTHEEAERLADDLARLGINCVRFHHMDSGWGQNIFEQGASDTRHLSAESLERLDYLVAQFKERGIYSNLNLNVSRRFREGDGVRDYKLLGFGKSATYYNPRLIELQREYARQLLTHRNQYTGNEYRNEPAVAVVEMVNENSVLEGWVGGRLVGKDDEKATTWSPIPVSYAEELTEQYNAWLEKNVKAETLAAIQREAGAGGKVARLRPDEFARASKERFHTEATFYMELERTFFEGMRKLLKDELGVKQVLVGTADHNDGVSGYAHITSNLVFDLVDGHGYWEHPNTDKMWIKNTPMVNDPLDATVTQFARTPVVGKPYTISEVNHPFPHEYTCEGWPILTAYAMLHDWDGIYWFTWGRGWKSEPGAGIQRGGWFDFSNDPVKVANLAVCGYIWHRQDVRPAEERVVRSYANEEIVESLRMERNKERPFFTPGFARSTPLEHATRWRLDGGAAEEYPAASELGKIVADTGEIEWLGADRKEGVVKVDTARTQALVGFVPRQRRGDERAGGRGGECVLRVGAHVDGWEDAGGVYTAVAGDDGGRDEYGTALGGGPQDGGGVGTGAGGDRAGEGDDHTQAAGRGEECDGSAAEPGGEAAGGECERDEGG